MECRLWVWVCVWVGVGGLPLNTRGKNNNGNPAEKKNVQKKNTQLKRQGKQLKKKLDNNSNSNSLASWLCFLRPEVFGGGSPAPAEGCGCGTFAPNPLSHPVCLS